MVCGYGSKKRLVGITSWTITTSSDFIGEYTCGSNWRNLHGVFTNISHYSDWINENLVIKGNTTIPTTSTNPPKPTFISRATWYFEKTSSQTFSPYNIGRKSFSRDSINVIIYSSLFLILIVWT